MKKKNAFLAIFGLLLAYIVVASFFFYQYKQISQRYAKLQNMEIETVREKIDSTLNGSISPTYFETEFTSFIEEHPMEIIIQNQKNEEILFTTMKTADIWSIRDLFHDDVVLYKAQGPIEVSGTSYFVSYVIYNISDGTLVEQNFKELLTYLTLLTILILIVLSMVVFILLIPLEHLKKAVSKMNMHNMGELIDDENVIAAELNTFTKNLHEKTKKVAREYTELEVALQFERERLLVTMDMSRAFVHDLKTPIHQTLLENELAIQEYANDNKPLEVLSNYNVHRSDKLLRQVNEILSLMDTKVKDITSKKETFDFIPVLESSWKVFQFFIQQRNLTFYPDVPERLEVFMNLVGCKLILHNIFSNIVQYAKEGTEITCVVEDPVDGYFQIKCMNDADKEDLMRMVQSEEVFSNIHDGHEYSSGNGLYLVRELTELLQGTFQLETTDTQATLTITLPVGQVVDSSDY